MSLSVENKRNIENVLKNSLRNKFQKYSPESINMPFHTRLLGKDRMALFSFIQSLNTTFGTSIYEPVAIELAKIKFKSAKLQQSVYNYISEKAQRIIQNFMDKLTIAKYSPDKNNELKLIREVCQKGKMNKVKLTKVDIWLESNNNEIFLIDLKTVKPNIGEFKGYKRTLLEWAAAEMANNPNVKINTLLGIPYNPYEPEPYDRWTMKGMFDLDKEILIADELWEFFGGKDTYKDLLDCFEKVGIELRDEIDNNFEKFK